MNFKNFDNVSSCKTKSEKMLLDVAYITLGGFSLLVMFLCCFSNIIISSYLSELVPKTPPNQTTSLAATKIN